jgi:hypothetical protein
LNVFINDKKPSSSENLASLLLAIWGKQGPTAVNTSQFKCYIIDIIADAKLKPMTFMTLVNNMQI